MNRPIWQRIGAILCCLLFICCFGFRINAEAVLTELVIGGVVVASVALLASVAVVSMGSAGLSDPLIDAANQANTDAKNWTAGKIRQFMQTESEIEYGVFDAQVNALCNGIRSAKDGTITVSRYYADWFSRFADWLIDNDYIDINSTGEGIDSIVGSDSTTYNDLHSYIEFPFSFVEGNSITYRGMFGSESVSTSANVCLSVFQSSDKTFYVGASMNPFTVNITYSSANVYQYTYNNESFYMFYYIYGFKCSDISIHVNNAISNFQFDQCIPIGYAMLFDGTSSTGATSGLDVWNDDTATDGLVLDPSALLGDAVNDLAGAIANVGDYIGTLADVIAGVENPALPVVGVGDIPISIPADIVIPVTPAIPADIADSEPVTGEDTEEPYTGTGDYTLPLADFFPFCIPFDIYKMLSLLSAAPVAPSVDYPFPLPGGGTYTIHIDLSQFDSVAQVLRTIETLAFCVGLGFATKKLLFGS